MLAIRLSRTGKKHQAYFRIVVSDHHRTPTAKFVEILGNYDPHAKKFQIDKDRLAYYLKNGAQPSNSVAKLLKNEKIEMPKWVKITEKKKAPKKVEEKAAPKAEAAEAKEGEAEVTEEVATETPKDTKEETVEPKEEEKSVEAKDSEEAPKEDAKETEAKPEEEAK